MTAIEVFQMLKLDNPCWQTPFSFISHRPAFGKQIYYAQLQGPYDLKLEHMGLLYEPWEVGQLLGGN